jgi:tRNA-dihydrouridine synthase 2
MHSTKVPRRSPSPSSITEERIAKRRKIGLPPLTSQDFKDGVMLAPMVRSGTSTSSSLICFSRLNFLTFITVVTRLFALKYGANLVWGPEIVDKAILHAERRVNRT